MKSLSQIVVLFLLVSLLSSCNTEQKLLLFNGEDLENWTIFLSDLEVDPGSVFWVEDEMIQVAGIPYGYIRTKESYSNFKLHLEWRWTEEPENSGVLIHVQGEDQIWPLSIECQLMHENAGDIVLIGMGSGITIKDSTYLITSEENPYAIIPKFEESSEKPIGEWNSYDIKSLDGTIEIKVNDIVQHTGSEMSLTEGNILLQSEGAPMQFRNFHLIPL